MATTTNYGWDTPDDTDLVKDGAAAIRTLGSSVDTTTKNLNPQTTTGALAYRSATANINTALPIGTANQVLRVNSGGTAPEWATTADQTPLTTKGDLFTFTTVDARLGVGANNTVLTADSAEATGLKWAAPAGAPSQDFTLINSGGTALTGSGTTTINVSGKNQIFIRINPAASAVGTFCVLHLRFNSDSGANYLHTIAIGTGSAGVTWGGFERATADSEIPLGRGGNTATDSISADVLISGANATGIKPIIFASYGLGTSAHSKVGTALYTGSSAITSVNIISSGQNFDAGTVFVYGA